MSIIKNGAETYRGITKVVLEMIQPPVKEEHSAVQNENTALN